MWASELIAALRAAADFEAAAAALFASLSAGEARLPPGVRLLRGLVHRRDARGYEGLAVFSPGRLRAAASAGLGRARSAWRWASATGEAVLLDVEARSALRLRGGEPLSALSEGEALSDGSALQLAEATHVLAIPLRDLEGALGGVVSLELLAAGPARPESWLDPLCAAVERVDVAAPWLLRKPLPSAAESLSDAHLPVVGARVGAALVALERLARFGDTPILLRGPPGSGKTCLARWIHARSPAAKGPFEVLQLQNMPDDLLAGELFGWRKGAHSQATSDRPGLLERARGGTLLLDEVGTLSLATQARLLELLDTGRFRPLGWDGAPSVARVRVLLATNEDLEAAVATRRFRADLYDRVAGASFTLRALAERPDEIPAWAELFSSRRAAELGVSVSLAPEVGPLLIRQPWPGNLRQLDQVMRNAIALAGGQGVVGAAQVREALALRGGRASSPLGQQVAELGRTLAALTADREPPVELERLDVLRAYTLAAAVSEAGSVKEAFLRFGEERLVESRNYNQAWRRATEQIQAFEELVEALSCSEHEADRVQNTKPSGRARR